MPRFALVTVDGDASLLPVGRGWPSTSARSTWRTGLHCARVRRLSQPDEPQTVPKPSSQTTGPTITFQRGRKGRDEGAFEAASPARSRR